MSGQQINYRPIDVIFDSADQTITMTPDNPSFNIYPPLRDIVGMAVMWVNVPFTYNVIDDTSNLVSITDANGGPYNLYIKAGTYNITTIVQELNSLLTNVLAGLGTPQTNHYVWYVDNDSSKLVLYNTTATAFSVTVGSGSPLQALGMIAGTVNSQNQSLTDNTFTTFTHQAVVFPRVVNLTGPNQMFLHSSLSSLAYGCVRSHTNKQDLIGFFPVNANYQGMIESLTGYPQMIPITRCNITTLSLYLTIGSRTQYSTYDLNGNANGTVNYLPLNGEGFQVCIRFYQQDRTNEYVTAPDHSQIPQSINRGKQGPKRTHVFTQ